MEVLDLKKHLLFNVINLQPDIDKIYLFAKDPYEAKHHFFIEKWESAGLKHFNDSKAFIEYSIDIDVYLQKHWKIQAK